MENLETYSRSDTRHWNKTSTQKNSMQEIWSKRTNPNTRFSRRV